MKLRVLSSVMFLLTVAAAAGKDQPSQVIMWPESGTPVLRFTLGKFKDIGSFGTRRTLVDITAENLGSKVIPSGAFSLYLFDKTKVRIGEGWISLNNVGAGQAVKFQVSVDTSGTAVSPSISARSDIQRVSITVNSVPQGALLKVDGKDEGITPKMIEVGAGKHMLEFDKEGYNAGHFPLEIGANDVSGGSVSYELGTSAHDTIDLRDGSVLSGDLESVSATEVLIRIGGTMQHLNRNQVKRVSLVERDAPPSQ